MMAPSNNGPIQVVGLKCRLKIQNMAVCPTALAAVGKEQVKNSPSSARRRGDSPRQTRQPGPSPPLKKRKSTLSATSYRSHCGEDCGEDCDEDCVRRLRARLPAPPPSRAGLLNKEPAPLFCFIIKSTFFNRKSGFLNKK